MYTPPTDIPASPLSEFYHLQPLSDSSPRSLVSRLSPVSADSSLNQSSTSDFHYEEDLFDRVLGYNSVSMLSLNKSGPPSTSETSPSSDFSDFLFPEQLVIPKLKLPKVKKQSIARSRRACLGCRTKKLKCDEAKPSCSRCVEKGLSCNYTLQLQFREDVEAKGKRFGREGINSSGNTNKLTTDLLVKKGMNSHYQLIKNSDDIKFINFFVHDVNENEPEYHLSHSLQSSIIPQDVIYGSGIKDVNSLGYALNYYIHFISPILSPVGNNSITYQQIENNEAKSIVIEKGLDLSSLMKYSQKNNAIFFLILSLGSMYLSKLNDISERAGWLNKARHFQDLGLGKIQPEIERLITGEDTEKTFDTDLLVCLVLLILYEFANDCDRKWTVYLKLCKKLLTSKNFHIPKESLEYSLLKFCLEFLDYQESMGRTACKDVNMFFLELEEQDESAMTNQVSLVSWMGCDRRLIPIISDITDLSFERFRNSVTESDYLTLSKDMLRRINETKITSIGNISMEPEEVCFLLACEAKRLSTELYLQSCLMCLTPEDDIIHDLVHEIFKHLEYIIITNDLPWSSLIWPVFMASSQISCIDPKCEELRYLALSILDKLDCNSLGNIGKTRKIIVNIWKKRDMANSDLQSVGVVNKDSRKFKRRKRLMGFVNDWEKFVVEEDYAIALA